MRLVADIGGTNTRLAMVPSGSVRPAAPKSYRNADYASFEAVISEFLPLSGAEPPDQLVVAMAGPVTGNTGRLTNLDWLIDGAQLSMRFSDIPVRVINDLTALGYSALRLSEDQLKPLLVRDVPPSPQRQALVVGIGTGFNVSPVVDTKDHIICPSVEAGHTSLYASIAAMLDSYQGGRANSFPSVESLFSGRGRRKFLSLMTGQTVESATPFIQKYRAPENAAFDQALDAYAELIGALIAELKLAYLPTDGIFLAGGVTRSSLIEDRVDLCCNMIERDNDWVNIKPPVWMIDDDTAALTGCASIELAS
ncbi:MAG: glucokinase [Rhodobacteraceae bacterium]|nr:glucokinase [Paracoccaceae bacterium]